MVRYINPYIPGYAELFGPEEIGGVIGYDDADGTNWFNVKSDVEIVSTELKSEDLNALETASETYIGGPADFGGFAGEFGESASATNLNVKATMNFDFGLGLRYSQIGGVFGTAEESLYKDIVSDFELIISGSNNIYNIGGFTGETDSASFSSINSKAKMNIEVGCSYSLYDECNMSTKLGGFSSRSRDTGYLDIKSNADITLVFVDSDARMEDIGGFVGYDDETNFQKIVSNSKINIVRATPANNSLEVDGANFVDAKVDSVGGFLGERDDYSAFRGISSTSTININLPKAERVGGFLGYDNDYDGMAVADAIVRGSVTVPAAATQVGSFVGDVGQLNIRRVILSVALNTNGATEDVNQFVGGYYTSEEDAKARSRINDVFINSDLLSVQDGYPVASRSAKQLKSSKFLKANGFDLSSVYTHKEGQFPVVKINAPFAVGTGSGSSLKAGQSNGDTSISFGKLLSGGSRNYFVNLRNVDARKVADLVVFRAGKVVQTIVSSVTNGVGNYAATSKFKLKVGDVLQVRISGKVVSKLLVK